jgi:hypothetical protein
LGEENSVIFDPVDEPVFLGDSPRPDTGSEMAESFRLPDSSAWIATNGFSQFKNPKCGFPISFNPMVETETLNRLSVQNLCGANHSLATETW